MRYKPPCPARHLHARSFEFAALLPHQAADLPPPGLREALDLVGRLPPQSQSLLDTAAAAVRLLEAGQDGRVERILQVLLGERRALGEAHRAQFLGEPPALLGVHGPLLVLCQVDQHLDVLLQVHLGADQHQGRVGTVLADLGNPPLDQVPEGAGPDHAVAEEEDVGVLVAERSQAIQLVLQGTKRPELDSIWRSVLVRFWTRSDFHKSSGQFFHTEGGNLGKTLQIFSFFFYFKTEAVNLMKRCSNWRERCALVGDYFHWRMNSH